MPLYELMGYLATIFNILIFVGSIYYNILNVLDLFKKSSKQKKKYQIFYSSVLTFNIVLLVFYTFAGSMYKTHILLDVGFSLGYFVLFPFAYNLLKKIE